MQDLAGPALFFPPAPRGTHFQLVALGFSPRGFHGQIFIPESWQDKISVPKDLNQNWSKLFSPEKMKNLSDLKIFYLQLL